MLVRDMVYQTLHNKFGYTVLQAGNSQDAINLCREQQTPIHLLLTDVIIPGGISGPELSKQLLLLQPKMKVLYMSGYPDNSIIHQGILNERTAFLQKPFTPHLLSGYIG